MLIEEVPTWLSAKNLRHPNELNTTRSAEASPGSIRVSIGAGVTIHDSPHSLGYPLSVGNVRKMEMTWFRSYNKQYNKR